MIRSVVLALLVLACPVSAGPTRSATFALIIGVNRSTDRDTEALRFADDDAAQYFELFRILGARTYLLTELDPSDRALYPQAAAEAATPTRRELDRTVARLVDDLGHAHRAGISTVLYVIYAGHGNVGDQGGYVSLADGRLTGQAIAHDIIDRAGADQSHLIVDACYSYLLTLGRGPGGQRRALHGFAALRDNFDERRVGLLLSTSAARKSHEWQGFAAGVFSFEVRAGLQGAADVDGDGMVSYREIAAFVTRANAAIQNASYRPDVYARPPRGTAMLLDIRTPPGDRIGLDGEHPGHYVLEDSRGVRLAELHTSRGQAIELIRRRGVGTLYLRDLAAGDEIVIDPDDPGGPVADRPRRPAQLGVRGPADELFGKIFALPFDQRAVAAFSYPAPVAIDVVAERAPGDLTRRRAGWLTLGVAGVVGVAAGGAAWSGYAIRDRITADAPQLVVVEENARIRSRNHAALGLGIAAAAATVTGVLLVVWPDRDRSVIVVPTTGGIELSGRF